MDMDHTCGSEAGLHVSPRLHRPTGARLFRAVTLFQTTYDTLHGREVIDQCSCPYPLPSCSGRVWCNTMSAFAGAPLTVRSTSSSDASPKPDCDAVARQTSRAFRLPQYWCRSGHAAERSAGLHAFKPL